MIIFMAIKRPTSFIFFLYLYGTIWNSVWDFHWGSITHNVRHLTFYVEPIYDQVPIMQLSFICYILNQSFKNYMYLEIPFVYMHERFILCMLRIHYNGKNNIAFVYDITLFILQFLSITYLGTHILKNMYGPCLCKPKKKTLYSKIQTI